MTAPGTDIVHLAACMCDFQQLYILLRQIHTDSTQDLWKFCTKLARTTAGHSSEAFVLTGAM